MRSLDGGPDHPRGPAPATHVVMPSRWGFVKTGRYWIRAVIGLAIFAGATYLPKDGWGWILVWMALIVVGGWLAFWPFFVPESPAGDQEDSR